MRRVIAGAFIAINGVIQAPVAPEEGPTSRFANEAPSAAELERRKKFKHET